jgi:hypothetical protein
MFPVLAHSATYYAEPKGSAANDIADNGAEAWTAATSADAPVSIGTALVRAIAGDVVNLRDGTYTTTNSADYEHPAFDPTNSGTVGSPITFQAYTGETPVFTTPTNGGAAFGAGAVNYIVWDGITGTLADFTSDVPKFAQLYNSTGSVIKNSTLTGFTATDSNNNTLIALQNCDSCEVFNNTLKDMLGSFENSAAIWNFGGTGAKIYQNTFTNCKTGIAQKVGPTVNAEYYRNFFYDINGHALLLNEQYAGGSGVKVYQNVIVSAAQDNVAAIRIYWSTQTQTNYQIYNNTIYSPTYNAIDVQQGARTAQIWNNIISSPGRFVTYLSGDPKPSYSDYNCFFDASSPTWTYAGDDYATIANWRTATSLDAASVTTDPGFLNAGGSFALVTDFKRAEYTANGRGGDYATVMGAYITGSELIGYQAGADTTPPVVAITEPAAGAVSGTISVTATCTDAVGCAGVQFKANGTNIGAEDTETPFSISWDTTVVDNGNYSIVATGRDAAGNSANSATVAVNVANAGSSVAISAINSGGVNISNINSGGVNVTIH